LVIINDFLYSEKRGQGMNLAEKPSVLNMFIFYYPLLKEREFALRQGTQQNLESLSGSSNRH
jgi:hypothetical protein